VADVLVGNEEDFQLCLGVKGPEAGGKGLKSEIEGFKEMIKRVKAAYPHASTYATTLREVVDTNHHLWGAIMAAGDEWHVVEPRDITVMDRIGGGMGLWGGCCMRFCGDGSRRSGYSSAGPAGRWRRRC